MNFKSIKNIIRLPSKYATGVYLYIDSSGKKTWTLVNIHQKKEEIEILECTEVKELESLKEALNIDYPIFLTIDGKGILHKKLGINENDNVLSIMNQFMPNAKIDQFYMQQSIANNDETWVSIARKEMIDKELEIFKDLKVFLQDITIGPFNLQTINNLRNVSKNEEYQLNHQLIQIEKYLIQAISKSSSTVSESYQFDEKEYNGNELLALGTALQHFIPDVGIQNIQPSVIVEDRSEFYHRRIFKKMGPSILVFFLIVLLANFFVFDYYNQKLTSITSSINTHRNLVNELNNLRSERNLLNDFIASSGIKNTSHLAYYADQLAAELPGSIVLTEMAINPLIDNRNSKNKEVEEFQFQSIRIQGHTRQSLELNDWIKKIKSKDWSDDVIIVNYHNSEFSRTNEFELLVEMKQKDV